MTFRRSSRFEDTSAPPLHLLEVVQRPDVAHEQQAFERLHVGTRGDHVHGDGDARVVVVAEVSERGLRVRGPAGDLAAEVVAGAELLPDRLDDVVGVAVRLGEDQGLGKLAPAGEDVGPLVAEGPDDCADLVGIDDRAVQLGCAVVLPLLLDFPSAGPGLTLAPLDKLVGSQRPAALGDMGLDEVDLVAHVDLVGNRPLVAVFADDVLLEKPVGPVVRRGGQADQVRVEVLDHLPPDVVDGPVAFVNDDHVEVFRGDAGVVDDGERLPRAPLPLGRVLVVRAFGQFLSLQRGVHALDRGDDDLAVAGDVGRGESLDVVELREFAVVVAGDEGHELLFGLLAQVAGCRRGRGRGARLRA